MICHRCGTALCAGDNFCSGCGLNTPTIGGRNGATPGFTPAAVSVEVDAGFWLRAVAIIIDRVILGIVSGAMVLVYFLLADQYDAGNTAGIIFLTWTVFGFLLRWLYFTLMESSPTQATLGKAAVGIIVTGMEGKRITLARANGRYFAKYLSASIIYVGYFMAAFTDRKQALHDLIAGTLVVRK
jgi:uncharacterized RDD family membrane protein YckC